MEPLDYFYTSILFFYSFIIELISVLVFIKGQLYKVFNLCVCCIYVRWVTGYVSGLKKGSVQETTDAKCWEKHLFWKAKVASCLITKKITVILFSLYTHYVINIYILYKNAIVKAYLFVLQWQSSSLLCCSLCRRRFVLRQLEKGSNRRLQQGAGKTDGSAFLSVQTSISPCSSAPCSPP